MIASRKVISLLAVAVMALSIVPGNRIAQEDGPVIVTTDKNAYVAGETVQINVTVFGPFVASFSSTCMCFFVVEDALGNSIYDLRLHSYWFWVLTTLGVPYGTSRVFEFTWNQKDDAGKQVQPGTYKIWGYIAGYNIMDAPVAAGSKLISTGQEEAVFEVALEAGWNLVSVPLVDHGYMASTLGLVNGDLVAGWNPATQRYDKCYVVGLSPQLRDFAIEEGNGYWIHTTTVETLNLQGTMPNGTQSWTYTVPGTASWVMIGLTSLRAFHASELLSMVQPPGAISMVVGYDEVAGGYHPYIPEFPFTDFLIVPGQGFWASCTASFVLTYPA